MLPQFVTLLMAASAGAQQPAIVLQDSVRGRILSAGTPIAYATIRWKGTDRGVLSDSSGHFRLQRSHTTDTLQVTAVGLVAREVVAPPDSLDVSMEPVTTDAVVVQADATGLSSATVRTERLSSRDLTKAACCSLAESFEKSPSVEVSYSDAVSGARQIQLLGLRGTYTQFLTEAVPTIRGMELPYGLDHIPGPFMESISISKGAATVTQGYEAMTGQINVEFKKPMTDDPLFLNVYGNTLGRSEVNVTAAQPLTDELATSVMGHVRNFRGTVDQNDDGFLDMPQFQQINLLNRWWYNDDEVEVQVLGRMVIDDYASGQKGTSLSIDAPRKDLYTMRTSIDRYEGFAKLGLLNALPAIDGSSIAIVASGASHRTTSVFGTRQYAGSQQSAQVRAIAALPFSDVVSVIGGLSWQYDEVDEAILGIDRSRRESVPGVFAEATLHPVEPLTVVAGLRLDEHNLFGTFVTPRMHLRYAVSDMTTVRLSAGRGYRVPTIVAENISAFVTSLTPLVDGPLMPEISWNYGGSVTHVTEVFGRAVTLDAELYHTEFENQLVVDYDRSPYAIFFSNLGDGRSYATSAMAQVMVDLAEHVNVNVAYRWVDVQATYAGVLQQRPMTSRDRILVTGSWASHDDEWQVDATVVYTGGGRLPSSEHMLPEHRRGTTFPGFVRVNGQIQRRYENFDIYLGVENATNFFQTDPIMDPANPFGPHFDASMAWGPTDQRFVYAGIRFRIR